MQKGTYGEADVWQRGAIETCRGDGTYDVRYDDDDEVQTAVNLLLFFLSLSCKNRKGSRSSLKGANHASRFQRSEVNSSVVFCCGPQSLQTVLPVGRASPYIASSSPSCAIVLLHSHFTGI